MGNELEAADRGASQLDEIAERSSANSAKYANPLQQRGGAGANTDANSARTLGWVGPEEPEWDTLPNLPTATPAMLHGVLGELAKQAANGTEVNPVAVMLAAMSWASAAVGRNHALPVGDEWLRPNLFTLHVGRSSKGGKGMALGLLKRVIRTLRKLPECVDLPPLEHTGGLSSTEGLICLVHDGYQVGNEEIEPIDDKRLWVVESEFANVLAQGKRDGNTLSAALRNAWDGQTLAPAVKASRVWATHPHIALHGSITPGELRKCMGANDLSNGFANRFLLVFAERTGVIPFPPRTSDTTVAAFAERLAPAILAARAGYPHSQEVIRLRLSESAKALYADQYRRMAQSHPAGELITNLLQRQRPMLLRIALLLALLDGYRQEVQRVHIEAAAAWMDYFAQSVAFVFGPLADVEGEAHRREDAEKLYAWLVEAGDWCSRKAINKDCFKGHMPKPAIDAALERLTIEGRIERREVDTGGTKKRTDYRAILPKSEAAPASANRVRTSSQQGSQAETPVVNKGPQNSPSSQPLFVHLRDQER